MHTICDTVSKRSWSFYNYMCVELCCIDVLNCRPQMNRAEKQHTSVGRQRQRKHKNTGKYLLSLTLLSKRGQYSPVAGSELMPTHKDTRAQGCSSRVNSKFHELCRPEAHRRVNFAALLHTGHACNKTKCSRGRG